MRSSTARVSLHVGIFRGLIQLTIAWEEALREDHKEKNMRNSMVGVSLHENP